MKRWVRFDIIGSAPLVNGGTRYTVQNVLDYTDERFIDVEVDYGSESFELLLNVEE